MSFSINRCGYCIHQREKIDGWLSACDAFPDGNKSDVYDIPGKGCANGIGFNVKPDRKEEYQKLWGDKWCQGPFEVEECYQSFVDSEIAVKMSINGKTYHRIIGKLDRYYDGGTKLVLLIPIEVFYQPANQITMLTDEIGNIIEIPDCNGFKPLTGLFTPRWRKFACLVEPINGYTKYQIGDYIRLLTRKEM